MSVEFRQRKPAEYARILWRRKWAIMLPAAAIFFAVGAVVWRLPNVYQSTTLLIVRPSSLTEGIVPQLADSDLTIRINNIGQEVLSRTALEPMIVNFNLYAAERRRGEPMEAVVEQMRNDIKIDLSTSRNDITNGFQISYKGSDRVTAQKVASELAGRYVTAQVKQQSEGADTTKKFVDEQLQIAKDELDGVEQQRFKFLTQNLANLPTNMGPLVQRLSGLYEQQKSYMTELGRLRDSRAAINTRIGTIKKMDEEGIEFVSESQTDPKTTLPWAELSKQESQLESEVQAMRAGGLKAKNPEVISKQKELESVQRRKELMLGEWKEKIEEKRKKLQNRTNPQLINEESSLKLVEGEIARQERQLEQARAAVAELEGHISKVPGTEVGLSALDRDFQTKKAAYDGLLAKKSQANLGAAAASGGQADTIKLVDPASMPEEPIAPKRPLLMALGLALGLGVGLLFAAAFEVPRLMTVQTVEDARHYTSLPVLVSVPELTTPREQSPRRVRRVALAAASVAAVVVGAPALAFLLKFSRILEVLAI